MKNPVFIFLFLAGFTAKTQTGWDLQQCINYALNHNIALKQTSLNNEINKNNADQSKATILPSINAGANHVYNIGRTIDRYTNTFANSTVLSQNFFIGGSVVLWSGLSQYNNMQSAQYTYLSGVELLKQKQNDLSLSIANAYIGVIFSEEIFKISQNQYNITKEQLERTQKMVTAGALAKSVEYDIKAQLANEDLNVVTADNNYRLALLTLTQLMNLDSVVNFSIQRPELNVQESQLQDVTINGLYETSLKHQPGIKSGEYSILSAERNLSASRGRMSPTLTFNANMGTGTSGLAKDVIGYNTVSDTLGVIPGVGPLTYNRQDPIFRKTPFDEQFKNNVNKSIGFTLQIPLFNGLQTHTSVQNAKINALNVKLSQDLTKQNLYKNITQAYANARAALNKYHASLASVDAANESFKYAQQKFNAGTISPFDFNSSKNRLYAAESNLVQAKYDYIFKLKVLDYYQGKPLGF